MIEDSSLAVIAAATETDELTRQAIRHRCAALIARQVCPSCEQFAGGEVFPGQDDRTFYQDERVSSHLESYPRGVGHTIIVAREHQRDFAEAPLEVGYHMLRVSHAIANALKHLVGAERVYLVTMCSGRLSHVHWQLIPRRPGELIGGQVFSSARGVLVNYTSLRDALAVDVRRRLTGRP